MELITKISGKQLVEVVARTVCICARPGRANDRRYADLTITFYRMHAHLKQDCQQILDSLMRRDTNMDVRSVVHKWKIILFDDCMLVSATKTVCKQDFMACVASHLHPVA